MADRYTRVQTTYSVYNARLQEIHEEYEGSQWYCINSANSGVMYRIGSECVILFYALSDILK